MRRMTTKETEDVGETEVEKNRYMKGHETWVDLERKNIRYSMPEKKYLWLSETDEDDPEFHGRFLTDEELFDWLEEEHGVDDSLPQPQQRSK